MSTAAGTARAQPIEPSDYLAGLAIGAFNTHDSHAIVRSLPERGIESLWTEPGEPSVLFAAIGLAERNSYANFLAAGTYRAAVSTSADAALATDNRDFLLVLLVPSTDRFGEDPFVTTINVTGALQPVELEGSAVDSVYACPLSLTDLPPRPSVEPATGMSTVSVALPEGERIELRPGVDATGALSLTDHDRTWSLELDDPLTGELGRTVSDRARIIANHQHDQMPLLLLRAADGRLVSGFTLPGDGTRRFESARFMPPGEGRPELVWVEVWSGMGAADGTWSWWVLAYEADALLPIAEYGETGIHVVDPQDTPGALLLCTQERRGAPEFDVARGRAWITTNVTLPERLATVRALEWSPESGRLVEVNARPGPAPAYTDRCVDQMPDEVRDASDFGERGE